MSQATTTQNTLESLDSIDSFPDYLDSLLHSWLKILTALGFTLFPIFFILDIFIIPSESISLLIYSRIFVYISCKSCHCFNDS